MIWLAWRQFRAQAIATLAALAALALLIVLTGEHLRQVYDASHISGCNAYGGCPYPTMTEFGGHERILSALLGPALVVVPALLGIFWGAPLLARELETGTYRLAWTQSITRTRWLAVKAAFVGLAALAAAGLTTWLVSWWYAPLDKFNMDRFDPSVFGERGIVAIGYAGFAFALGLAAGALLRRTLPAMATTLVTFIVARIAFTEWVRPYLLGTAHTLQPVGAANAGITAGAGGTTLFASAPTIANAWVYSGKLVDRDGASASQSHIHELLHTLCPQIGTAVGPPPGAQHAVPAPGGLFTSCMARLSHQLRELVTYQPPSHYWPLQGLETAIFLALALALVAATVWLVRR
jgi:hypothetical protein